MRLFPSNASRIVNAIFQTVWCGTILCGTLLRGTILCGSTLLISTFSVGQDADVVHDNAIEWTRPFDVISAAESENALAILLITNDPATGKNDEEEPKRFHGWCTEVFADSYREFRRDRPDLRGKVSLQWMASGLPKSLTGGKPHSETARAVVLVCDSQYRLLSFLVGVPEAPELATLVEDAQDFRSLRDLAKLAFTTQNETDTVEKLARRSSERMTRLWRNVLAENVAAMNASAPEAEDNTRDHSIAQQIKVLGERFDDAYRSDVRLRFGLSDASSVMRLTTLEQHVQTRRPWCEAMIPFIAGMNVEEDWKVLVEMVWGYPPIGPGGDAVDLIEQVETLSKDETFVFAIQSPLSVEHIPWPPIPDPSIAGSDVWQKAETMAQEFQFRSIDLQQLARIIDGTKMKSVDVRGTSLVRYVILPAGEEEPIPVYQADRPARIIGLMKRYQAQTRH